ncbi:MAG: hypothetical protein JSU68_12875 [Phycisphaerales bacterium]|nr:MAG: hypothetical protein JSU68_12875 [Phycisphaerales bacterium]
MAENAMRRTERNFHTRDANGRSVRMIDPVMLLILHRFDTIDADALHDIVETMEPGTARFRRHVWIIIPAALAAFALLVAFLYYTGDASARKDLISTITNPVFMIPNIVCCCVVPWIVTRQNYMKHIRSAMLKHRRCPHCGYDLRGTPTAADGNSICSECGCAWLIYDEDQASPEAAAAYAAQVRRRQRTLMLALVGLTLTAVLGMVVFMMRR